MSRRQAKPAVTVADVTAECDHLTGDLRLYTLTIHCTHEELATAFLGSQDGGRKLPCACFPSQTWGQDLYNRPAGIREFDGHYMMGIVI